eukprot:TRINITY_DN67192_c4_g3_i1.p1 TRINITY_DN67192_c4_g3~~TRINITY_DN67192_c4_g3_i1.p1  ORF type:complete len:308 (+),score=33.84 TRINITY_DN67192_c4_g3_i1:108-926(+)
MTKRLTADLRGRVRRLAHYAPLSQEWVDMTDTLQHLASVAMMEEKDCAKKEGSIWERDELCVRYIIEEGKINMLMRTMNEFKQYQYTAEKEGSIKEDVAQRVKVFEQSLGILLRCSFMAVEALQTLDLTQLIEHIAFVLKHSIQNCDPLPEQNTQEIVVLQYLTLVVKQIEQLNEEAVMGQIESNEIVPLVLNHYEVVGQKLEKPQREAYCFFLAHLMETEFYQTHRAKFITGKPDKERLAMLEALNKELMQADSAQRKLLRALSDNIIRFK